MGVRMAAAGGLGGPRARLGLALLLLAAAALVGAALSSGGSVAQGASADPPIGVVNAFGPEQAPILAEMHVTGHRDIDGYRFWLGTIGGYPVVDVASGEVDETAELASEYTYAAGGLG
jgi:adenosylhomocysteine nucleosidase